MPQTCAFLAPHDSRVTSAGFLANPIRELNARSVEELQRLRRASVVPVSSRVERPCLIALKGPCHEIEEMEATAPDLLAPAVDRMSGLFGVQRCCCHIALPRRKFKPLCDCQPLLLNVLPKLPSFEEPADTGWHETEQKASDQVRPVDHAEFRRWIIAASSICSSFLGTSGSRSGLGMGPVEHMS